MTKKRYTFYLSEPLARKLKLVARQRHGSISAIIEEAIRALLEPQRYPGIDEEVAQQLDELSRAIARIELDGAILGETFALFVRYFLAITPVLPESEQESARRLGRERFQVFLAEVGRQLHGEASFVSEVLKRLALQQSDCFATASHGDRLNACNSPVDDAEDNDR